MRLVSTSYTGIEYLVPSAYPVVLIGVPPKRHVASRGDCLAPQVQVLHITVVTHLSRRRGAGHSYLLGHCRVFDNEASY